MNIIIYLYLRMTLGLLFVVAGLSKARDSRGFQQAMTSFHVLPPMVVPLLAPWVIMLELIGGTFLVLGLLEWIGGLLIAGLLLAFIVVLSLNLARGRRDLDCRCFGRSTAGIGWGHVVQNVVLLAATSFVIVSDLRNGMTSLQIELWRGFAGLSPIGAILTILGAAYSVIAFLSIQELLSVSGHLAKIFDRRPTAAAKRP